MSKTMRIDMEEDNQASSLLTRAIDEISSLIILSYSIKVFHVKWQVIRNKLEELKSGLTAAKICDSEENVTFQELVSAILVTVTDCHSLAKSCIEFSYTGKLLMQSNLNVVSANLDVHIKKLAGIYNAGILTHASAIVVSRPSVGASQEDKKFYVNDLLTRMKTGGSEMKSQALISLKEAMEDKDNVRIVLEMSELVTLLVNFIEFEDTEIQEESINVIMVIAGVDAYKGVLVGAGVIAPLVHVLATGSEYGKELAARCLQKLTENSDNAWSVSSHGGVPTLLKICNNGDSKPDLICSVSGVLKNLSGIEEINKFMVEDGLVSSFIKLLGSKDEIVQINAIIFLQIMVSRDEYVLRGFIKEEGIQSLVCILEPKTSFSSKVRKTALEAIESICFSSKSSMNILNNCKFLNKLLFFLCDGEFTVQESALEAVLHLCRISEETKKAMGETGFMSVLLALLDAKCSIIREMAAEGLSSMLTVSRNRRRFMEDDCNTSRILQMLDTNKEKLGNNTRFLLSSLMSLTSSNSGRRRIVVSSHFVNLEKLAEAEVVEAKKIIRKLSSNRFRIMLDGIWHT
ncbi:hypothetical protein ACHQM5_003471 [Ranunculus cassubicifolius]